MSIFSLFRERPEKIAAQALYPAIVAQSRQPEFYSLWGVPDTFDGRFEILVLHSGLVMRRLTGAGAKAAKVSQALFDHMFIDMDQTLRELGVGDITVPKKIKHMGEAFFGRSVTYDAALAANDLGALGASLARNVYRQADANDTARLARYALQVYSDLRAQSIDDLADGRVHFPAIDALAKA